jgi:hypothetical protein
MKIAIAALILIASTLSFAASPCKPAVEHKKLEQNSVQNVQKKVNLGGDPWRLDPKEVAARQIESMDASLKAGAIKNDLQSVKSDERTQVLSYKAADRNYEITMKKPEWLLPYAGIYKTMMWNVTDVKTICAGAAPAKASPKMKK